MIRLTRGNLLDAKAEALVNTVNTVGVMGKGIALQFKEAFPDNFAAYAAACERGEVAIGRMFVFERRALLGPRWIINFPTKKHWIHPSRLDYVRAGLDDLVRVVREQGIRSIAIPPLGAGHGGLDWAEVRPLIEEAMAALPEVDVTIFEPTTAYQAKPKRTGEAKLTPARALVVDLIRRYVVLGFDCSILEVQKLVYFLQLAIRGRALVDPFGLAFKADRYGPYAHKLRFVLDGLDGSYLRSEKRIADARPFDPISLDLDRLEVVAQYLATPEYSRYAECLDTVDELIDGFQSPYHMELLASVDWVVHEMGAEPRVQTIREGLARWPGGEEAARRKQRLFDDRAIELALDRLTSAGQSVRRREPQAL